MITVPAIVCEVKPATFAEAFAAPIIATPADVEALDLAADFGPPDDSPLWDEWATDARHRDLVDAGLLPF